MERQLRNWVLTLAVAAAGPSVAQGAEASGRIYVGEITAGDSAQINPEYLAATADMIRGAVVDAAPQPRFRVVSRAEVEEFMAAAGPQDCLEGQCIIRDAERMTADYAVESSLIRLGELYNLNIKLHGVKDKSLLGQVEVQGATLAVLLPGIGEKVRGLVSRRLSHRLTGGALSGVPIEVPVVELDRRQGLSLSSINIEADERWERAIRLQGDARASPTNKRDAWCDLAEVTYKNRYLSVADKTCKGWQKYVQDLNSLSHKIVKDHDNILRLRRLSTYSDDDKRLLMDELIETYSVLEGDVRVAEVRALRAKLEKKVVPAARPVAASLAPSASQDRDPKGKDGAPKSRAVPFAVIGSAVGVAAIGVVGAVVVVGFGVGLSVLMVALRSSIGLQKYESPMYGAWIGGWVVAGIGLVAFPVVQAGALVLGLVGAGRMVADG